MKSRRKKCKLLIEMIRSGRNSVILWATICAFTSVSVRSEKIFASRQEILNWTYGPVRYRPPISLNNVMFSVS